MPTKLKAVPTAAEALRDAGACLAAAHLAEHDARTRLEAFDPSAAQEAETATQESVRLADENMQDALADGDEAAIAEARERRAEAIKRWNAARGDADEIKSTRRGFERRLERAQAEQATAHAAFTDAEVHWLRSELVEAERAYAKAAEVARDSYCRVRAVHFRLRTRLGEQGRGMALSDTEIKLPVLGEHSRQLRAYPDQPGPMFEARSGNAHVEAAAEALRAEIAELGGES